MKIFVDNKELEVSGKRVLIEELREAGYDIPSLCYTPNAKHHTSCMICKQSDDSLLFHHSRGRDAH